MDRDIACGFFDLSWLAIRGGDVCTVARVLDLSEPVSVRWLQGLHAVQNDYWDFEADISSQLSRLFLTPELDGWLLVIGGWVGGTRKRTKGATEEGPRGVAERCRILSSLYGSAHAFTTQGRMDYYSWTLTEGGTLKRLFVWDGKPVIDEGVPSDTETKLILADKEEFLADATFDAEDWTPGEPLVMALAAAFSLDIDSLGPSTRLEGNGYLYKTDVGRVKGIPLRPLCDCQSDTDACT
jgi:hypothetical protein